jgi:hypothetical protein
MPLDMLSHFPSNIPFRCLSSKFVEPSEAQRLAFRNLRGRLRLNLDRGSRLRLLTAIHEAFAERSVFGRTHAPQCRSLPEYLEFQAAARAVRMPTSASSSPLAAPRHGQSGGFEPLSLRVFSHRRVLLFRPPPLHLRVLLSPPSVWIQAWLTRPPRGLPGSSDRSELPFKESSLLSSSRPFLSSVPLMSEGL